MDFLKKPIWTYIGMIVAFLAIVFGVVLPEYATYAWTIAGILGYGSVAALRTFIDSKGWKTTATFIVTLILAALQIFKVITPELYQQLMVVFAPIIGATMQNALAKSSASVPKVADG